MLSATEAPTTSTPTLSRSSSISGGDASGLQTSVFSQVGRFISPYWSFAVICDE